MVVVVTAEGKRLTAKKRERKMNERIKVLIKVLGLVK